MKVFYIIILVLLPVKLSAQTSYFLPENIDSDKVKEVEYPFYKNMENAQFDFTVEAKPIDLEKKILLFKNTIVDNNIQYVEFITNFDNYDNFVKNLYNYDKYPFPDRVTHVKENLHYFDFEEDGGEVVIFDDFIPELFDYQSIYMAKFKEGKWIPVNIDGFIITNAQFENKKLKSIDTYRWACCSEPYDIYRRYSFEKDSLRLIQVTAIAAKTDHPKQLNEDNAKPVKVINDSIEAYSLNKGELRLTPFCHERGTDDLIIRKGNPGYAYGETVIENKKCVFVELKIRKTKFSYVVEFTRILAWIKKEDIKYE
jgi:hypothetical protein